LKSIKCEVWHGLIFIRFGGEVESIASTFAEAEIGLYNIEKMQPLDEPWRFDYCG